MTNATLQNAQNLTAEVLRNEIVSNVDQMERIEVGDGEFASAMTEFPLVNLDDPQQAFYTLDTVRGPMESSALNSEAPLGSLELPDRGEAVETEPYKKKYNPEKGVNTTLADSPYTVFGHAASVIRLELFVTREQITWRGDRNIDGFIGQYGTSPHPDLPADQVVTPANAWSDTVNSTPYDDVTSITYQIMNNGRLFEGDPAPNLYLSPSVARDLKRSDDMENRVSGLRIEALGLDDVSEVFDESLGRIRRVMVYVPRTNANGEYIDDTGTVVEEAQDAALDNILEPWDPAAGAQRRHAVIGRPGVNSAYVPWFLDRLNEYAQDAPPNGDLSIDGQNGFLTQIWSENDPLTSWFKGMQEVGFQLETPQNWGILTDL